MGKGSSGGRRHRFGWIALPFVIAGLVGLTACDPRPVANVYITGDSNMPAREVVGTTHLLRETPYLTIIDTWPGLGVAEDADPYGDGFATNRLGATLDAAPVDFIVTNFGGNDRYHTTQDFVAAARDFMNAAGGTPVIWVRPAAAGPESAHIAELGNALAQLEAEFPNLWVVPFDALLVRVGACPSLTPTYQVVMKPVSACYADQLNDVHLSEDGEMVLAAIVRASLDLAVSGSWRTDLGPIADQVVAALPLAG